MRLGMLLMSFLGVAISVIQPRQLRGSDVDYKAAAVSADRALVAAGGDNGRVLVWDSTSGSLQHALVVHAKVQSLVFASEGTILIVGTAEQGVQIWTLATGQWVFKKQVRDNRGVNCLAVSSTGKIAAFGSDNHAHPAPDDGM